jgi:hypothetical protein
MLIDADGRAIKQLQRGQRKYLPTDRVMLALGPPQEVKVVRWMYEQVVKHRRGYSWLSKDLNSRGIPCGPGGIWTDSRVKHILTNESYIGNSVYNRTSSRLGTKQRQNPPEEWIRVEGTHPAIIDARTFRRAQVLVKGLCTRPSNEFGLNALRDLWKQNGKLNSTIINLAKDVPGTGFYEQRFGSLVKAYKLIGYKEVRSFAYLPTYRERYRRAAAFRKEVARQLRERDVSVEFETQTTLLVNGDCRVGVKFCPCYVKEGKPEWRAQQHCAGSLDWLLAARMDVNNDGFLDYFLLEHPVAVTILAARHYRTNPPRERLRSSTLSVLVDYLAEWRRPKKPK